MKRKKILTSVIVFIVIMFSAKLALDYYASQWYFRMIKKHIRTDLSKQDFVQYIDTHGGFHGDGETYIEIKIDDQILSLLVDEVIKNPEWNFLPMDHVLDYRLKVLCEEYATPEIKVGYYWVENRDTSLTNHPHPIIGNSNNYTVMILSLEHNTLYFYKFDS